MRHLGRYNDIIWIPFAANTPSIPLPICNASLGLGKENVEKPKHCTYVIVFSGNGKIIICFIAYFLAFQPF